MDEIWTLRLIRSLVLTLVMAASAHPAAMLLGKPEFAPVILLWSFNFTLDGLASMSFATAVREQKLWRMALLDLGTSLFQFVSSVVLALIYHSYWALIVAMILGSGFKVVLSYAMFPHSWRRLRLSRARAREMWEFSRFIAPSSLMSLCILQADKLILVRMMPLATFGLYTLAATIASAGAALASNYCRRVLYPAFAETVRSGSADLRKVFYTKRRWPNRLYMLATGAMGGGAELIVSILYDHRYLGVALYLRLLAISATLVLANTASEEVLIAAGNLRATLNANVVRIIWLILGVALAIAYGNTLVLVAVFGLVEVAAMGNYWFNLRKTKLFDPREELAGLFVGGIGAGLGYAVGELGLAALHALSATSLLRHMHAADWR